jgi:DNA-binding NarL/FixJ family response regulator
MSKTNKDAIDQTPWGEDDLKTHLSTPVVAVTTKVKTNGINGNVVAAYTDTEKRLARLKEFGDTSKAIRALTALGWTNGAIARELNVRPQHVSNVRRQKYNGGK